MQEEFLGYHSEWNMGSPGGWDYQRMAQEIGKFAWEMIKERSDINVELDFDDSILNPVPNFARLLLRCHQKNFPGERPFIALVAEEETLDKVGENIRFVEYLNTISNVKAVLIDPGKLELKDAGVYPAPLPRRGASPAPAHKRGVYVNGDRVTTIFLDFNNNVIVKLKKRYNLYPLFAAIKQGMVINPRGLEPIGSKGVFEAITSKYRGLISKTILKRTPWTRQFYPRATTGPDGEPIPDLIKWVKDNWSGIVLKPVHGYSGEGIIIGPKVRAKVRALQSALDSRDYIVQQFIPLKLWTEEFPWIDRENKRLFLKHWQTDFRCFVTDIGLIGFVTRFGGIPTNVGSGGGVQSTAILRSHIPVKEAIMVINKAILNLGFNFIWELQQEIDKKSVEIGNVYLLGPIMSTLRPRIITPAHVEQLKEYAKHLWRDVLVLESLWLERRLTKYVQISSEEESIARLAPGQGRPALIAADGLFGFE